MMTKVLACVAAFLITISAKAQVFNEGYTFNHYFSTLAVFPGGFAAPDNWFQLRPEATAPFLATATIAWQLFEGQPVGAPSLAGVWQPGDLMVSYFYTNLWQDGEGSFRITILGGSQSIDYFNIHVFGYDPVSGANLLYSDNIRPAPVPEPMAVMLLVLGIALSGLVTRARRI